MRLRILVADQSEALFYEADAVNGPLKLVGELADPKAHLHDRDLVSDRPGRVFDHAPPASGRRGAVAHHSTGSERTPRKHEAFTFATRIAEQIEIGLREKQFDGLVLMAGPAFLGLLRQAMSNSARDAISSEVPKDLVHQPQSAVLEHLPPEAFQVQSRA